MKSTKAIVRILAIVIVAAMSAGLFGCVSSYRSNPVVAKVGSVKLDLSQYLSLYNNTDTSSNMYYAYMQYGLINAEQYAKYILDDLVNYGVQLDQIKVQGITLDAEEEAKVLSDTEAEIKNYLETNYASKIDSSITDETAKYEAELELLKADLADNKTTFEEYRSGVEESIRNSALLTKLRDVSIKDVTVDNEQIKAFYTDNTASAPDVSSFKNTFTSFMTAASNAIPLRMPHPERAVEDDPETEDKDESKAADPYGEIFSVQHLLFKFKTAAGSTVTDLAAYAAEDKELSVKMSTFEETLSGLTREQFLEKCFDADFCDDPGMQHDAYKYFGYMMQESILSTYYDGFGYAAMKLYFGDEWEPEAEGDGENKTEPKTYDVTYFTLSDSTKIAKVFTTSGVHYIIINANDCFGMYDEDGYLMVPVYENDEIKTDADGIETLNGHMTQAQLDAVNKILLNVKGAPSDEETEEDAETVTIKALYDYCHDSKLSTAQSEKYNEVFKTWKENTKIVTKDNLIKAFYKG